MFSLNSMFLFLFGINASDDKLLLCAVLCCMVGGLPCIRLHQPVELCVFVVYCLKSIAIEDVNSGYWIVRQTHRHECARTAQEFPADDVSKCGRFL